MGWAGEFLVDEVWMQQLDFPGHVDAVAAADGQWGQQVGEDRLEVDIAIEVVFDRAAGRDVWQELLLQHHCLQRVG